MDPFCVLFDKFKQTTNERLLEALRNIDLDFKKANDNPNLSKSGALFDPFKAKALISCLTCEDYMRDCCGRIAWESLHTRAPHLFRYDFEQYRESLEQKKSFIKNRFCTAVERVLQNIGRPRKAKDPYGNFLTLVQGAQCKAIKGKKSSKKGHYLYLFRYAVHRIILDKKHRKDTEDPWKRFFSSASDQSLSKRRAKTVVHKKTRPQKSSVVVENGQDPFCQTFPDHYQAASQKSPSDQSVKFHLPEVDQHEGSNLLTEPNIVRPNTPFCRNAAPEGFVEQSLKVPVTMTSRTKSQKKIQKPLSISYSSNDETRSISSQSRVTFLRSRSLTEKKISSMQNSFDRSNSNERSPSTHTLNSREDTTSQRSCSVLDVSDKEVVATGKIAESRQSGSIYRKSGETSVSVRHFADIVPVTKKVSATELTEIVNRLCRPLDRRVHSKAVREMLRKERLHHPPPRLVSHREIIRIVDRLNTLPPIQNEMPIQLSGEFQFQKSLRQFAKLTGRQRSKSFVENLEKGTSAVAIPQKKQVIPAAARKTVSTMANPSKFPQLPTQKRKKKMARKRKLINSTPDLLNLN